MLKEKLWACVLEQITKFLQFLLQKLQQLFRDYNLQLIWYS
ncbi:hypothetical protein Goshw_005631, partial [Gossypium schwendimanii]|nr:hypothetical protein [Gossypium schwendimanii]